MQIKTPCCKLYLQQGAEKQIEQLSVSFIRTIPSVPELHRFSLCGSRTFTAGGELHSAPKQIKCIRRNLAVITLYTRRADLSIGGRKLFRRSLRLHAEFVERRELFDEAAGIVKYKKRKATAQKKLENERENLVRVNDILAELERQVGPLERQAEKARIYLKKKEELKEYDVNMFLLEVERIEAQLKEVEGKYHIADEESKEASQSYENIKSEYEKLEQDMASMDDKIAFPYGDGVTEGAQTKEVDNLTALSE